MGMVEGLCLRSMVEGVEGGEGQLRLVRWKAEECKSEQVVAGH